MAGVATIKLWSLPAVTPLRFQYLRQVSPREDNDAGGSCPLKSPRHFSPLLNGPGRNRTYTQSLMRRLRYHYATGPHLPLKRIFLFELPAPTVLWHFRPFRGRQCLPRRRLPLDRLFGRPLDRLLGRPLDRLLIIRDDDLWGMGTTFSVISLISRSKSTYVEETISTFRTFGR